MAKQTAARKAPPAARTRASISKKPLFLQPSHDAIAQRAFEIFLSRGAGDGSDLSDWLKAENELKSLAS
jgi:hypothetical protein